MKVNRFPYLVFYDESDEDIWVAAIAHERRRPDYWRNRKPE
jgi:toxin ParE1/3/4